MVDPSPHAPHYILRRAHNFGLVQIAPLTLGQMKSTRRIDQYV
jgi:hypothetical protein